MGIFSVSGTFGHVMKVVTEWWPTGGLGRRPLKADVFQSRNNNSNKCAGGGASTIVGRCLDSGMWEIFSRKMLE